MDRRTLVITGASDGIGAAAARQLAGPGHRLLLVGRSPEKTAALAQELGAEHFVADFARLDEVRRLAEELSAATGEDGIDALANNAGGIFGERTPTVDGHEKTFQINHLAPFLLTNLLLPRLLPGGASVIATSSIGHRFFGHLDLEDLDNTRHFSARKAYGDAKLANVLFTRSLHTRFHAEGLSAAAFHPGIVRTSFGTGSRSVMRWLYQSPLSRFVPMIGPEQGGATLAWFLTGTPGSTWTSGRYYDQDRPTAKVNPQADDAELAAALWQRSAELVGLD
ncbi:short-chain dehydrogenase [Brachybacterium avium]|uniref:Short-chain dehydrogenase n=1 Tax=Brachybacterium avium TaxID=2017485 RepID=A0A220UEN3_9MICO|nr:SDR family NAD(P)-dependent oxidoreductase [Brachybacterium avium]ASK66352.1 short-chain dehydrogenase [Brachybacterium avium]